MARRQLRGDERITVKIGDEVLDMTSVFISGKNTETECPMAMYGGSLDMGEMGISLMHLFRATITICQREFGSSINKAEEFILFCLAEAINRESQKSMETALDVEIHKIVKRFMDSQK